MCVRGGGGFQSDDGGGSDEGSVGPSNNLPLLMRPPPELLGPFEADVCVCDEEMDDGVGRLGAPAARTR